MAENTYVFEVGHDANKIQIKRAVEMVFGVSVEKVRTQIMRGKIKRFGRHYESVPTGRRHMYASPRMIRSTSSTPRWE